MAEKPERRPPLWEPISEMENICSAAVIRTIHNSVGCLAHLSRTDLSSEEIENRIRRCVEDELKLIRSRMEECRRYSMAYEAAYLRRR